MTLSSTAWPLISVITPAYNTAEFLPELLESVDKQDYPNIEHIVIDDGSEDNNATLKIIKSFPNLTWWSRPNKGQYASINEGILRASGDYIIVISADDFFTVPDAFSIAMQYCLNNRSIDIIYGHIQKVNENGIPIPYQLRQILPVPHYLFKYHGFVSHCSLFVSRKFILDNNLFWNEAYRYAGDWDWVARVFSCASKSHCIKKVLSLYRVHSKQISNDDNNAFARKREVELISKQLDGNIKITQLIIIILNVRSGIYKRISKFFSGN